MQRLRKLLVTTLVVAGLTMAPSTPAAAGSAGTLWLTSAHSGCVYTATVYWVARSARSLEVFLTENAWDPAINPHIATTFVPIKGKNGTTVVTMPELAASATINNFYAWAQLIDLHGDVIPGSRDFASIDSAYCTAP